MISFALSPEQIKAAPREVRRWIESEIAATLAVLGGSDHDDSEVETAALAACTAEDAAQVFELIKGNFLVSQIFFELAREAPDRGGTSPLHALSIGDMLRHARLTNGDALINCFNAINQAFRKVRGKPDAMLFGFDRYGHGYIQKETHHSIRAVWEALVGTPTLGGAWPHGSEPSPFDFTPSRQGPSEDVAQHLAEHPGQAGFTA